MKRLISHVILFLVSIAFFFFLYVDTLNVSVATLGILLIILVLYGLCAGLGWKSIQELKKYEKKLIHFGLNQKDYSNILLFSLAALAPTYFCVTLVSLVPLYTYEVWFITVFPCILLNCFPASSVLEEYCGLTHRKLPFLAWFCALTASFCLVGVMGASLFLK